MAPELFIKAYTATSEEYQLSEEAPKIDAKNPAGEEVFLVIASHTIGNVNFEQMDVSFVEFDFLFCKRCCTYNVVPRSEYSDRVAIAFQLTNVITFSNHKNQSKQREI